MIATISTALSWALRSAVVSLAVFALLNCVAALINPRYDANPTWLSWSQVPGLGTPLVAAFGCAVLGWSRWHASIATTILARLAIALVATGAWVDSAGFWRELQSGRIQSSLAIPLSLGVALLLSWWVLQPSQSLKPRAARKPTQLATWCLSILASSALWVLLIIQCTGATSYARPGDAIVVLGARVYEDGKPSLALEDRVHTACELYEQGFAAHIVMSGGWADDAPVSEPEAMRAIAEACGIPRHAIILDVQGLTTQRTIDSLKTVAKQRNWRRIIAVTHDYHCSRVWLAARQAGLHIFTVPARESRPLRGKRKFIAREVLAWGWYWIRGSAELL